MVHSDNFEAKRASGERPKKRKSNQKYVITSLVVFCILLIVVSFFLMYRMIFYPAQNMGFAETPVSLYAGPGTQYAYEESVEGYFTYDSINSDGWMQLHRQNENGETVLRWVNSSELTNWGKYQYSTGNPWLDYFL